jgi:cell division septation protein DedD
MSNFEWENIEKKAGKKKYISLAVIFIAVSLFIVYYKKTILVESDREVIKEELLTKKNQHIDNAVEERDLYNMAYTVKIGRFLDFDRARDFIIKNNIKVFNIYKEGQDIYVNLGPISDFEKVQQIKDDFIKNGYPAIVELFEKREEVFSSIEEVAPVKPEVVETIDEKITIDEKETVFTEQVEKKTDEIQNPEKKSDISLNEKVNSDGVYISDPANLKTGFTIQVAAFRELSDATMTKNKLRFSGINPVIIEEGGYFKVQIGLFDTKKEAEDYVRKYDKSVIPDYYIKKVQR